MADHEHRDSETSKDRGYTVIPTYAHLSEEESETVERGGPYPARVSEYLREHETFLDYLIERSADAWTRSRG